MKLRSIALFAIGFIAGKLWDRSKLAAILLVPACVATTLAITSCTPQKIAADELVVTVECPGAPPIAAHWVSGTDAPWRDAKGQPVVAPSPCVWRFVQ